MKGNSIHQFHSILGNSIQFHSQYRVIPSIPSDDREFISIYCKGERKAIPFHLVAGNSF